MGQRKKEMKKKAQRKKGSRNERKKEWNCELKRGLKERKKPSTFNCALFVDHRGKKDNIDLGYSDPQNTRNPTLKDRFLKRISKF